MTELEIGAFCLVLVVDASTLSLTGLKVDRHVVDFALIGEELE